MIASNLLCNTLDFAFLFTVTTISACSGLCNLCRLENVTTDQSSVYIYSDRNDELTSRQAIDGKFQNHRTDCAGTWVISEYIEAWWKIILPDLANIYKINLMFRENSKLIYYQGSIYMYVLSLKLIKYYMRLQIRKCLCVYIWKENKWKRCFVFCNWYLRYDCDNEKMVLWHFDKTEK